MQLIGRLVNIFVFERSLWCKYLYRPPYCVVCTIFTPFTQRTVALLSIDYGSQHFRTVNLKTDLRSRGTVVAFGAAPLYSAEASFGAIGPRGAGGALALEPEPCLRAVRTYRRT